MKTALVTGAGGGIGSAIAGRLAADGYTVAFHSNTKDCTETAAAVHGIAVRADLADTAQIEAMIAHVLAQLGHIDVLVNNAGISVTGLLTDISPQTRRRLFDINVLGAIECTRLLLPSMISRRSGCVLNISSMWGQVGASCEAAYSASKGAVIALTKALAQELGPSGIRVNCVSPGVILTDMTACVGEDALSALAEQTPLGRNGTPEDVAAALKYLAEADYVTGQILPVNGGFVV